jgi:RNA polymerase sigma-70 factor (ECF subfamily)
MSLAPRIVRAEVADAELVAAIARGNLEALGDLFERHEPSVRRYLARLGLGPSDADDLVQATFLEVVQAAGRFDLERPVRSWLLGIATILVRRRRRTVRRYAARLAAWSGIAKGRRVPTPDEVFDGDEAFQRFQRAFDRLSPKKREAFVLVTLEGLSGEEAAAALGIPVNTVWTRLHHARQDLRAALGEDGS